MGEHEFIHFLQMKKWLFFIIEKNDKISAIIRVQITKFGRQIPKHLGKLIFIFKSHNLTLVLIYVDFGQNKNNIRLWMEKI